MEPNNFEKDFRKKLHQRTINPSDKGWDRLDAMLNVVENQKPKKKNLWMYWAAATIGFLFVGTLFFTSKNNTMDVPKDGIVVRETSKKDTVITSEDILLDTSKSTEKEVVLAEKVINKNKVQSEKKQNQESIQIIKKEKNQVAESSIIIKNNQSKQSIGPIANTENSRNESTEELLHSADKNVLAENSTKPKSKVRVNANDLLDQVDGELALSFREKVIAKVNKNYQTVKTAVANRNQQE